MEFILQALGDYKIGDAASALKARDHKDATDLVLRDGGGISSAVDVRNYSVNTDVNPTIQAKSNGGFSLNYINPVQQNQTVRRLTPLECERLQGFPDGWTDIGEWVDDKGRKRRPADSPRYKALGNSIARPFWTWLLSRISAQYDSPPTLGSLFDGISGFTLSWAEINGAENCKWTSEIESFPIAVVKRHFGDEETGEKGDLDEYLRSGETP